MKCQKGTAYHEAAHAVAGAILLKHFAAVSVDGKSGEWHGGKREVAGWDQYSRWNMAVLCISGPYAEARAMKRPKWESLVRGGEEDAKDAEDLIDWLIDSGFSPSMESAWEYIENVTPKFLSRNWQVIERVAVELMARGSLDAQELQRIIERTA